MDTTKAAEWLDDVVEARRHATTVQPVANVLGDLSLTDAYGLQGQLQERALQGGWRLAGHKVGMTNRAGWDKLGISDPVWGPIYDQTVHHVDTGSTAPFSGLISPMIEAEIAFGVRETPSGNIDTPDDLLPFIDWMAIAVEVIDCHLPQWELTPVNALSDFFFHAALLVGKPQPLDGVVDLDAALGTAKITVEISRDGETTSLEGVGANVLGSPLASLATLVRLLHEAGDPPLQAGEIVTTGTFTPPESVFIGDELSLTIDGVEVPPMQVRLVEGALPAFPA